MSRRWPWLGMLLVAACGGGEPAPRAEVVVGDACALLLPHEAEAFAGHPLVAEAVPPDSTTSGCIWWADSARTVPVVQLTVHWHGGREVLERRKQSMALAPARPGAAPAEGPVEPGAVVGVGDEAYFSDVFASLVRDGDRLLELYLTHLPEARAAFVPLVRALLARR